jgi:hypothetical protein
LSPFVTDDPATIPDSKKIKLLKRSRSNNREFVNEGSRTKLFEVQLIAENT